MENHFEPHFTNDQLRSISSIGLAHMGDAVFEVLVREWLCAHGKAEASIRPQSGWYVQSPRQKRQKVFCRC